MKRILTQAGADYWNKWAGTSVDAGQEVVYNDDNLYNTSCNGEEWALDDKHYGNNLFTEEL